MTCGDGGEWDPNSGFGVAEVEMNLEKENRPRGFEFRVSSITRLREPKNGGSWLASLSVHHPSSIL